MDQYGIGIRLEIIDQTLQATNRILSNMERLQNGARGTADAFNHMNDSALHMNSLMEAGFALGFAGDNMQKFGGGILGVFKKIGAGVVQTGAKFETFRNTLTALYKDAGVAKQKVDWGLDFAAATPFDIDSTIKSMIGFKAIGIDVDKQIAGLDGKMRPLLQYIGDLAAFRPDVGMDGVLIALRNLSSGDTMSFKRRMDIDPEMKLGRKISTDPAQFQKDLVELAQKLAPNLMETLNGTWSQMFANLGDQAQKFFLKISDSGAFNTAKKTLASAFNFLNDMDEDRMQRVAKLVSSTFDLLWKPIDLAVRGIIWLTDKMANLAEQHPLVFKLVTTIVALGGATLVTAGFVLKMTGGILLAMAAITQLAVSVQTLTGRSMGLETMFMRVVRGAKIMTSMLAISGIAFAGAMFAYHKNLFGFRDTVDKVVTGFQTRWKNVNDALANADMVKIGKFDKYEEFFGKIILLGGVIKTLFSGDDGKGNVVFSEKQYELLKKMGLWDITVKLVMLKGRVEAFFKGFAEGAEKVVKFGGWIVEKVFKPIKRGIDEILPQFGNLIDGFLGMFGIQPGKTGDLEYWSKLGVIIGGLVTSVLAVKTLGKMASWIASPFTKMLSSMLGIKKAVKDTKDIINAVSPTKKAGGLMGGCCCCCDDLTGMGGGGKKAKGAGKAIKAGEEVAEDALGARALTHGVRMKGIKGFLNRVFGGSGMTKALVEGAEEAAPAAGKFSKLLKGIPILGTVLGLASGAATLWGGAKSEGGWKNSVSNHGGSVAGGAIGGVAGAALGSLVGPVGTIVGGIGGSMLGSWLGKLSDKSGITKKVVDASVWMWNGIKHAWNTGVKWVKDGAHKVSEGFDFVVKWAKKIASNLPYYIGFAMGRALRLLGELAVGAWNWGKKLFNNLMDWVKSIPDKWHKLWHEEIPNQVKHLLELGIRLDVWRKGVWADFKTWAAGIPKEIGKAFLNIGPEIGNAFEHAGKYLKDKGLGWLGNLQDFGGGFMDGLLGKKDNPEKHAYGGIMTTPHYGLVAEDGPEAIIPLDPKKRGRGLQLLQMTAQRMGAAHASGGIFGKTTTPAATGGGGITINNLSISIPGGAATGKQEDARAHAKMIAKELKKLLKEMKMRGGSNMTLEDLIMEA